MNKTNNKSLTPLSQTLRTNMTKEERHLYYDFLQKLPVTVHRQKVLGNYIVDFYCADPKTVIELDGSQHYEQEGKRRDTVRDAFLGELGIRVLRYSNLDVQQHFDSVCTDILLHLNLPHLIR